MEKIIMTPSAYCHVNKQVKHAEQLKLYLVLYPGLSVSCYCPVN